MNLYNRVQSMHGHDWGFEQIDGEELIADIGQTANVMLHCRIGAQDVILLMEEGEATQVLSLENVDINELNKFVYELEAHIQNA